MVQAIHCIPQKQQGEGIVACILSTWRYRLRVTVTVLLVSKRFTDNITLPLQSLPHPADFRVKYISLQAAPQVVRQLWHWGFRGPARGRT